MLSVFQAFNISSGESRLTSIPSLNFHGHFFPHIFQYTMKVLFFRDRADDTRKQTFTWLRYRKRMSKLNLLYSCKKIKKSLMRGSKDQVVPEFSETGQQNSPLGYFDTLPLELKFTVFSFMSALELSYLTITSKSLRNIVELYRKSERGLQNLLKYPLKHSHELPVEEAKYLKQFKHIGLLLKRSTCLYSTKDRLVLALTFLHKFQCNFQKDCVSVSNCIALTCYGVILHTFTAGWDDRECIRTFETVCQSSYMSQFLDFIIKKKAGALPDLEMHVRFFFRRVFLNNMFTKAEKSFWLNLILKPFPIVHQARILYLLFGPSSKVGIQWHEVCESTPPNKEQTLLCFGNIANALLLLNSHCSEWSDDTTLSVLDELFSYPEEWLSENIASLLFLCGENLTLKILVSKAINGRIPELAYIISSLCLVCLKQGQTLSWVVNIVTGICVTMENTGSRRNFLHAVVDMFREVITDVHEFNENLDDESSRDLHNLLNAQTAFMKELIEMAYKNMLT